MKLCVYCWEPESSHPIQCVNHDYKCHGNYVEIDDKLAKIIKVLNIKGYTTQFCCEGHVKKGVLEYRGLPDMYIKFNPGIYDKLISQYTLGEGWKITRGSGILYYRSNEFDKYRIFNGKTESLKKNRNKPVTDDVLKECESFLDSKREELYQWVLSLKPLKKDDEYIRPGDTY